MTLHDLFTLLILPDRNIEVQYIIYTSEYILKLQIHQHFLLTRKVFSLTQFISTILLLWIIIKAGSLLEQRQVWIITRSTSSLDHHQINIKAGSSLDHHQHHCFCYLEQMVLSLNSTHHRKFYRANPFSCWVQASPPCRSSSTDLALFHAG